MGYKEARHSTSRKTKISWKVFTFFKFTAALSWYSEIITADWYHLKHVRCPPVSQTDCDLHNLVTSGSDKANAS